MAFIQSITSAERQESAKGINKLTMLQGTAQFTIETRRCSFSSNTTPAISQKPQSMTHHSFQSKTSAERQESAKESDKLTMPQGTAQFTTETRRRSFSSNITPANSQKPQSMTHHSFQSKTSAERQKIAKESNKLTMPQGTAQFTTEISRRSFSLNKRNA